MHFEQGGGAFEVAGFGFPAFGLDVARFRRSETIGDLRHRERLGFQRRDAVDPPRSIDELLDELSFGGALGFILIVAPLGMALVGGGVFGRQQDSAAGEAVGQRVEGGVEFTSAGAGVGGLLGFSFCRGK